MGEISSSQNGCYTYRTDSSGYVRFLASSALDRDVFLTGQLQMHPKNVNGYYRYETVDNWPTYSVDIYQMPAFLMQMLAAVRAGELSKLDFFLLNVAPYLEDVKQCLIILSSDDVGSGLVGLLDSEGLNLSYPHCPASYYLLTTIIK